MLRLERRALMAQLGGTMVALLCVVVGGCIPLPFVSPPIRGSISGGIASGKSLDSAGTPAATAGTATDSLMSVRLSVQPLQVVPELTRRRFDVGLGYSHETIGPQLSETGGTSSSFLTVSYHPWEMPETVDALYMRIGVHGSAELLFGHNDSGMGGGATLSVTLEPIFFDGTASLEYHEDEDEDGDGDEEGALIGAAWGEGALGIELAGGFREVGGLRYWTATAGLCFRVPASAGVFLVPLFD